MWTQWTQIVEAVGCPMTFCFEVAIRLFWTCSALKGRHSSKGRGSGKSICDRYLWVYHYLVLLFVFANIFVPESMYLSGFFIRSTSDMVVVWSLRCSCSQREQGCLSRDYVFCVGPEKEGVAGSCFPPLSVQPQTGIEQVPSPQSQVPSPHVRSSCKIKFAPFQSRFTYVDVTITNTVFPAAITSSFVVYRFTFSHHQLPAPIRRQGHTTPEHTLFLNTANTGQVQRARDIVILRLRTMNKQSACSLP